MYLVSSRKISLSIYSYPARFVTLSPRRRKQNFEIPKISINWHAQLLLDSLYSRTCILQLDTYTIGILSILFFLFLLYVYMHIPIIIIIYLIFLSNFQISIFHVLLVLFERLIVVRLRRGIGTKYLIIYKSSCCKL